MNTIVDDPVVPVQLRLKNRRVITLYQPGWHLEEGASAFPGGPGKVLVFDSLSDLQSYAKSASHVGPAADWSVDDFTKRLCEYDLVDPPELADKTLDEDEQLSLGSTLALALDLLDQLEVDDPHADALRDDPDIGRLASGDLLGGVFGSGSRRQHIVDLLGHYWGWCIEEISKRVTRSSSGSSGSAEADSSDAEGGPLLESVAPALTLWFGLSDSGVYTIRTTELRDGFPTYPGGRDRSLSVWPSLEALRRDLGSVGVAVFAEIDSDVDLTPHDDLTFDLVQIGESIDTDLTMEQADKLVSAWTELSRLAGCARWDDALTLLESGSAIGRFLTSCAIDRAQDRPGAEQALESADIAKVRSDWTRLAQVVESHTRLKPA